MYKNQSFCRWLPPSTLAGITLISTLLITTYNLDTNLELAITIAVDTRAVDARAVDARAVDARAAISQKMDTMAAKKSDTHK